MADEHKEHDLAAVWELLRTLTDSIHGMDKKIELHIQQYNENAPAIKELADLLERSKGVVVFLTWGSAILTAIAAAVVGLWNLFLWALGHIK